MANPDLCPTREVVTTYDHRGDARRDFVEDFSHENGNYWCKCHKCGNTFKGNKRRVTCKVCHVKT